MHNAFIHGLVTRDSSDRRMPLKPLRCAGLYKTEGACVSSPEVVTKPSPYTLEAFCLAITNTPQSGLANGPEWAALKIHRAPTVGDCLRGAIPVTVAGWFNSGAWGRLKAARPDTAQVNLPPSTSFRNGVGGGFAVNLKTGYSMKALSLVVRKNKRRAALKQIRRFLDQRGIATNGLKINKIYLLFLNEKGVGIVQQNRLESHVFELYDSGVDADVYRSDPGFYLSKEWRDLRMMVLKKYGERCMKCGSLSSPSVDHIKAKSLYPELALDISNLQVLCKPCNSSKSNGAPIDYRTVQSC